MFNYNVMNVCMCDENMILCAMDKNASEPLVKFKINKVLIVRRLC